MDAHRLTWTPSDFLGLKLRAYTKMIIRIGMEQGLEGRSLAWGLGYPGCFSYGQDDAEALLRFPHAFLNYSNWIGLHTSAPWLESGDFDLRIEQHFTVFHVALNGEEYEVHAFFRDDERLLSSEELERALLIYSWQRDELLAGVETLPRDLLTKPFPGERWDIIGILYHIAETEFWYLQKAGQSLSPQAGRLSNVYDLLNLAEAQVRLALPGFAGNPRYIRESNEEWTCRKVVRRLLWHQRDHIEQIKQLAFR